ncbi:peptide ABC transporter substrate-binding protein [Acidithiobacillus thiooxidans]|uniref:Oligopeptide-binding protein AppA n=1 Tax=Acidithiobacillus thiooxidans ATCC 19377 TaxID=637390 RepID=A0A543Q050_ACITH|nr:peptide ABC transporter substrate-binding protein [Acidithiobacillus thiooxidans]MDX5936333.1 peptide ABC transporter substrate-binding protein [Acidithiobacillus thiooxidans]TQN49670.1 Oligopeptide-binding protein AppA [Acidithiobacillus thiooxidans ATCC 19377]
MENTLIYRKILLAFFLLLINIVYINLSYGNVTSLTTVTNLGLTSPGEVNSLLPVVNNNSLSDGQIYTLMFRPLLWVGTNIKINWKKSIAKSIHISKNRKVFTIYLKQWQWSDGRPVTAEDALACLDLLQRLGLRNQNRGIGGMPENIKKIIKINSRSFKLILKHPVNPKLFELNGLSQIIPIPNWAWKRYSVDELITHQDDPNMVAIVDGPYKLVHFSIGRKICFIRNANYSGTRPNLVHICFKMYSSDSGAFWALRRGVIQAGNLPHYLYDARSMVKNLKSCVTNGGYGINYIALNFTNPKVNFLKNVKIRQALALAINQEQIIKIAYHGLGVPSFNPVPTMPDTYLSPYMKQLSMHPMMAYDPLKAKHLLIKAGCHYKAQNDILTYHGKQIKLTMLVPSGSETSIMIAELVKYYWSKIGVNIRLRLITSNLEFSKLHPYGKWEAAIMSWVYEPDYYPSGEGLFNSDGGSNYGDYNNQSMDEIIKNVAIHKNLKFLYKYERIANIEQPVIFLPYPKYLVKYLPKITHKQLVEGIYSVSCERHIS